MVSLFSAPNQGCISSLCLPPTPGAPSPPPHCPPGLHSAEDLPPRLGLSRIPHQFLIRDHKGPSITSHEGGAHKFNLEVTLTVPPDDSPHSNEGGGGGE